MAHCFYELHQYGLSVQGDSDYLLPQNDNYWLLFFQGLKIILVYEIFDCLLSVLVQDEPTFNTTLVVLPQIFFFHYQTCSPTVVPSQSPD